MCQRKSNISGQGDCLGELVGKLWKVDPDTNRRKGWGNIWKRIKLSKSINFTKIWQRKYIRKYIEEYIAEEKIWKMRK